MPEDYEVAKTIKSFLRCGEHLVQPNHLVWMVIIYFIKTAASLRFWSSFTYSTILKSRISELNEIFKYDSDHSEEREIGNDFFLNQTWNKRIWMKVTLSHSIMF